MSQPAIAVLGAGAMGTNHARVVAEHARVELGLVVDIDEHRARAIADELGTKWATDPGEAFAYDAVIVAVPTEHHLAVVTPLLEAGVPVLLEKPAASTTSDVQAILALAAKRGVPLLCGFVERFNPVVRTALEMLDEQPLHLVALRHSPKGLPTPISVVHDLLIHDIDLALLFAGRGVVVEQVSGTCRRPPDAEVDEIADCSLTVEGGMVAMLSASRAGQRKLRSVIVTATDRVFELDLLRQDLTVYRHVEHGTVNGAHGYCADTVVEIPFVRHAGEPLALQLTYFLDLVEGRADADRELATILGPHVVAELVEA